MAEGSSVRQNLLDRLLHSVKQCQIHFGARQEMATESDLRVSALCSEWEAVLLHGMRKSKPKPTLRIGKADSSCSLWLIARLCLSAEEEKRFQTLHDITCDIGRGRAWLRAAINERTLENYLHILLADEAKLQPLYESHAFILDQERASMLPVMAAGLGSILFSIPVDADYLNSSQRSVEVPVLTPQLAPTQALSLTPALFNRPHNDNYSNHDDDSVVAVSAKEKKKKRKKKSSANNTSRPNTSVVDQQEVGGATLEVGGATTLHEGVSQDSLSSSPSRVSLNSTNEEGGAPMFVALETGLMSHDLEAAAAVNATALVLSAMSAQLETTPTQTLPDSMSAGELREALLVLVRAKDELDDLNKRLQVELRESESSRQHLVHELEQCNRELFTLRDTQASQKQALERENDLLREQLKKYVEMVQAQRKESSTRNTEHIANAVASKDDESSLDTADLQRATSPSTEQKLTEMAEMYGELMELNERLHKDIAHKDNVIAKLVSSVRQSGAEVTVPTKLLPPAAALDVKPIVEVCIPSVIKKGRGPDGHHVYQVLVKVGPEEWNVYRRYAEFREFHRQLQRHVPDANSFSFPPKRAIGSKSSPVVEERKLRLQEYLRFVFKLCSTPGCCQSKLGGGGKRQSQQERGDPLIRASTSKSSLVNMFPFFREDLDGASQPAPPTSSPSYSGL